MSKKIEVWLDSGANAFSCYKDVVSLDEFGITDEEFESMTDDAKDELFRDVAFERSDWGWRELEE